MDIIPYTCIRCGYSTKFKGNMRTHFSKIKICPSIKNEIELTDTVKKYILDNRAYKIPKILKLSKEEIVLSEEIRHYIYLIRPKENVKNNQNVYKIGKTKLKELTANFSRMSGYGKGTELIKISKCIDCDKLERSILEEFNSNFKRYDFGSEYFIGSEMQMCKIIDRILYEQYDSVEIINNDNNKF